MPQLSVIIPTHRRGPILIRCVEHLERQTIANQIEVIVVSDGHDPETAKLMSHTHWSIPVTFFAIEKAQQGTARNRGVEKAKAKIVLFIGDDIFLDPHACAKHLKAYTPSPHSPLVGRGRTAVLGFTTWDPAVGITPVMRWLEQSGWQFGYPAIQPCSHSTIPSSIQHRFTYTSHISLPLEVARAHPFREDVALYGWEDIEWGWRLARAGVPLRYEPDANALHHHHMTLESSLLRMKTLGQSAVIMDRLNPDLHLVPRGFKRWKYLAASLFPTMRGRHAKAFLEGVQNT